ncbi:MAG: ATP synthase F1 subunit gamma [Cyanobacteria bacterium P01_H01_bin.74]
MPNLKDIRNRIKTVTNTKKITQAMRMVAAAKVKRAETGVKSSRPYTEALVHLFYRLITNIDTKQVDANQSSLMSMIKPREIRSVGLIICSSDRGLCGAYNSTIIRQAFNLERKIKAKGLVPKFYLVGNKIIQAFSRYSDASILGKSSGFTAAPAYENAEQISNTMVQAFLADEIDTIDVLSTHFISLISSKVKVTPVNPIRSLSDLMPAGLENAKLPNEKSETETKSETGPNSELLVSPDVFTVLNHLVPMYTTNSIYNLLLEGAASELAARMTAMSNATNNAGEMIQTLSIQYNKARQSAITQEILEIVSGADALK